MWRHWLGYGEFAEANRKHPKVWSYSVVAINKFVTDSKEEIKFIEDFCKNLGVKVALADVWEKGGDGGIDLAESY